MHASGLRCGNHFFGIRVDLQPGDVFGQGGRKKGDLLTYIADGLTPLMLRPLLALGAAFWLLPR